MKMMTFLAGVATGLFLAQSGARRGAAASVQPSRDTAGRGVVRDGFAAGPTGGDRDYPTLAPRTDEQLRERIRSQVARTIHNPEAIQVEVKDGCVTLTGRVHARDSVLLMAEVEKTTGVTEVRNELDIEGAVKEVVPPMTVDSPAVRDGERKSSHVS